MRSGEAYCDQELAEEARRGPLRSRAGSGGPARPTAIKSWQRRRRRSRASDIESNNPHLAGGKNIAYHCVKLQQSRPTMELDVVMGFLLGSSSLHKEGLKPTVGATYPSFAPAEKQRLTLEAARIDGDLGDLGSAGQFGSSQARGWKLKVSES